MTAAAEEAGRLFEAVQEWAKRTSTQVPGQVATGAPQCQLCPICKLIAGLRDSRPELLEHLTDAAGSLVAALRTAIDAHEREWAARRSTGVEHIDIG